MIAEAESLGLKVVVAPDSPLPLEVALGGLDARLTRCQSIEAGQSSHEDPSRGIVELICGAAGRNKVLCWHERI